MVLEQPSEDGRCWRSEKRQYPPPVTMNAADGTRMGSADGLQDGPPENRRTQWLFLGSGTTEHTTPPHSLFGCG